MGFEIEELTALATALSELEQESGRNAKEDILRKYADLPYFKETLKFLYDVTITTGISKAKLDNPAANKMIEGMGRIDSYAELLDYIQHSNTGRLADVSTVNGMISNYHEYPDILKMLRGVVMKDIPLGISATTINKVYGKGFIFKFDVMKGEKFEKHEGKLIDRDGNLKVPHAVTTKLDGMRLVILIDENGQPTFMARSGKQLEGLTELEGDIRALGLTDTVLDGELIAQNPMGLDSKSLFAKTSKIVRSKGDKEGLEYYVYDMVSMEEFKAGKSTQVYEVRRDNLKLLSDDIAAKEVLHIHILPTHFVTKSMERIQELATEVTDNGGEGLMLNNINGLYVTKRTNQLLKIKKFHTVDLRCTGVLEEIRGGSLGAIEVEYKGYTVKVGSGFSHAERERFWSNPDEIVGKIVEVGYFEETTNEQGGLSLRFPTFKQLRLDKDEVSYD